MVRLPAVVLLSFLLAAAAGCDSKKPDGLPPAKDWSAPQAGADQLGDVPAPRGAGDPHAGVPGAPPLGGGGGGGGDPHAGVPGAPPLAGGGGGGAANPHGPGGVDVSAMGLPSPDPMRPIDPNKVLEGTIALGSAHAGKVPAGSVIFIAVRAVDPSTGGTTGMPLATDKLEATGTWPLAFKLDESKMMVDGTQLTGDVMVTARFDQDHDAMSKQPGDIVGQVRTAVPAKGLAISLDQQL